VPSCGEESGVLEAQSWVPVQERSRAGGWRRALIYRRLQSALHGRCDTSRVLGRRLPRLFRDKGQRPGTAARGPGPHPRAVYHRRRGEGEGPDRDGLGRLSAAAGAAGANVLRGLVGRRGARVLRKSKVGEAVGYAANPWPTLIRYREDGWITMDNRPPEQAIRPQAVGRRNWLEIASDGGLRSAAVLLSVAALVKRNGVNPCAYVRHPHRLGGTRAVLTPATCCPMGRSIWTIFPIMRSRPGGPAAMSRPAWPDTRPAAKSAG
jgi:hypothetical protein